MLHRISVELKFEVMLFQLSLFITFNEILNDPAAHQYKVSSVITLRIFSGDEIKTSVCETAIALETLDTTIFY